MKFEISGKAAFAATGGRPFEADKPALVMIHGAGMDHTVWTLQARYFAHHGWSVLALDLPNHSGSEGPGLASIEEMADWVIAAIDAAGAGQAALVGHSMGALIALEAASRLGERALALLMLGVVPSMGVHPDLQKAADSGDDSAVETMISWSFGRRSHIGGNQVPGSWMSGAGFRVLERGLAASLGGDLAACSAYKGALEAAAKVSCPALILSGDEDKMTPAKMVKPLAEVLAKPSVAVLKACGHMMTIEQPDETLDAMRDFLKEAVNG